MKTARIQMTGIYLVSCSVLITAVYVLANRFIFCTKLMEYSLFLSGIMTSLFGISMLIFPNLFKTGTKTLHTVWCSILVVAALVAPPAYLKRDSLSCMIAQCSVFSTEPAETEGNTAYFTFEQLGRIALQLTPVRITRNTLDGLPHLSNDPLFVDSWTERLRGRYFPTHFISFTLTTIDVVKGDVLFRMDLVEIEGSPLVLSPPSLRSFGNSAFVDEGISLGEYCIGESRPLMVFRALGI